MLLDLGGCGLGIGRQQTGGIHDHARHAVAALHRAFFEKRLLEGVKPVALRQTFDRDDLGLDVGGVRDAGSGGLAADQDGARPAHAFSASVLGPGEAQVVAENFEEAGVGEYLDGSRLAVDSQGHLGVHVQDYP